jgi:anion-transporting  ArsA/GET3 family ATPase
VPLGPDLHGLRIDVERATEEYLAAQLHVRPLVELMVRSRAFHAFAQAAPGLPEIITVGKIWTLAVTLRRDGEGPEWDMIVVDCPATGHGLALLETAGKIRELAQSGPIRDQAARIEEVIHHPSATGIAVVARPEELPVSEAIDTVAALRRRRLPAALVVANAVSPHRFSEDDARALAAARAALDGRPDDGVALALSAALDQRGREAAETALIERLAASVDLPVVELPRIAAPVIDLEAVGRLADSLAENGGEAIDPRPVEAERAS